jgi:GNAT superfamily N-acetyltransferase
MIATPVTIRLGKAADVPAAFALIQELALYEKAPHEVENTIEQMLEDGFGPHPIYGFLVAESGGQVVGISLYYYRYSTWKGKRLYLEDLIVTETYRGKGIGKLLFDATIGVAHQNACNGMSWQVLEWNTPAIEFYKKFNASFDGEWVNCTLTGKQLVTNHK